MFVTLDVVFHEDTMYFSSVPEFQGENYINEIQCLDYDLPEYDEQNMEKLEISYKNLDSSYTQNAHEDGKLDHNGTSSDQSGNEH